MDENASDKVQLIGQKIPFKGAEEFDAFTGWRYVMGWGSHTLQAIKRGYNRRVRRVVRALLHEIERDWFDTEPEEIDMTYREMAMDAGYQGAEVDRMAREFEQADMETWFDNELPENYEEEEFFELADIQHDQEREGEDHSLLGK